MPSPLAQLETAQLAVCATCKRPFEKMMPDEKLCLTCDRPVGLSAQEDLDAWTDGACEMVKIVRVFDLPPQPRLKALERIRDVSDHALHTLKLEGK